MAVSKRKNRTGKIVWMYAFEAPGAAREDRKQIRESGFATKDAAIKAESARRVAEHEKFELAKRGRGVAAAPPKTLAMLLEEFYQQHAEEKLALKTVERYRELGACLDPALLAMPLTEIGPLHLGREWARLLKCGGHHRKTKAPRPLSAKTVRGIAGLLSSAMTRAMIWGLITVNPVRASEPPKPKKRRAVPLPPDLQDRLLDADCGPWCMRTILIVDGCTGMRRGELLALRWSDVQDGYFRIARSLSQTKAGLDFKDTKTGEERKIPVPTEALVAVEEHRKKQDEFRHQFGPKYRSDLDLIFCNPDGTPFKPNSISATVSRMFRELKIEKPKGDALHILRHTHASEFLDGGTPIAVVSARLGHKSIQTTLSIYGHMIKGQEEEAVRKWEERRQLRQQERAQQESQAVN